MINSAVILAIGHPEHHSQLAQDRPRAMLPALGKPLVVRVMEQMYRAGIRHFILIVGINEGVVAQYLHKSWVPDAKIELMLQMESEDLLTCLVRIAHQHPHPFILASYNCFTHERYAPTLLKQHAQYPSHLILTGAKGSLSTTTRHFYASTQNNIVTRIQNEPAEFILGDYALCGENFVDYLLSFEKSTKQAFGQHFLDMVRNYLTTTFATSRLNETSWILNIETDKDLLVLNKRLLEEGNDNHILSELPLSVKIIAPVRIDPQVSIGENAVIGPNVYVEKGSSVGYGSVVSNAIILNRGIVPSNRKIDNVIITARGPLN